MLTYAMNMNRNYLISYWYVGLDNMKFRNVNFLPIN